MNRPKGKPIPLPEPKGYHMPDGTPATRIDFIRFKLGTGPEPIPDGEG